MIELVELDLETVARALEAREFSAVEYADALLAQCDAESDLNASIALDPDVVRAAAVRADSQDATGPLHGVPLVSKDNIDVAGYATTAGTPALEANRSVQSARIVRQLELGFGNTTNNGRFGAARNPYDRTRIRAALCGVVGFRPTTGRYASARIVRISRARDTADPMVRRVADCVRSPERT